MRDADAKPACTRECFHVSNKQPKDLPSLLVSLSVRSQVERLRQCERLVLLNVDMGDGWHFWRRRYHRRHFHSITAFSESFPHSKFDVSELLTFLSFAMKTCAARRFCAHAQHKVIVLLYNTAVKLLAYHFTLFRAFKWMPVNSS